MDALCKKCGKPLQKGTRFCTGCGARIENIGMPVAVSQQSLAEEKRKAAEENIRDVGFSIPQLDQTDLVTHEPKKAAGETQGKKRNKTIITLVCVVVLLFSAGFGVTVLIRDINQKNAEKQLERSAEPAESDLPEYNEEREDDKREVANSSTYIQSIKLSDCPYVDANYGEMFDEFFASQSWDAYEQEGEITVSFSGMTLSNAYDIEMEFVFNKDASQSYLNKLLIDGIDQSNLKNPAQYSQMWTDMYNALREGLDMDDEYILPTSNSEYLTTSDLYNLSDWELMIARNEIYARHGRRFTKQELQDYFDSKSWYNGTIEPEDFDRNYGSVLNNYEQQNAALIISLED